MSRQFGFQSRIVFLVALFLWSTSTALAIPFSVVAGPIVSPVNGHTYYLLPQSNWNDAETMAVSLGAHLATVRNLAENDWIWNTFAFYGGRNHLWIGLNDQQVEGTFVWSDGEPVTFTNWQSGEPNNAPDTGPNPIGEDYVHLSNFPTWAPGLWNDNYARIDQEYMGNNTPFLGVAEIIPEPSTAGLLAIAAVAVSGRRRRG